MKEFDILAVKYCKPSGNDINPEWLSTSESTHKEWRAIETSKIPDFMCDDSAVNKIIEALCPGVVDEETFKEKVDNQIISISLIPGGSTKSVIADGGWRRVQYEVADFENLIEVVRFVLFYEGALSDQGPEHTIEMLCQYDNIRHEHGSRKYGWVLEDIDEHLYGDEDDAIETWISHLKECVDSYTSDADIVLDLIEEHGGESMPTDEEFTVNGTNYVVTDEGGCVTLWKVG